MQETLGDVEILAQQVSDLEDQDLKNKIAKYNNMLKKESSDQIAITRIEGENNEGELRLSHLNKRISDLSEELVELRLKADQDKSTEIKNLQIPGIYAP